MSTKPYAITKAVERVAVAYLVTDPKFTRQVGHALKAEGMLTDEAKLLVGTVLAYLKETGNPCTSPRTIGQRLRTLVDKGVLLKADSTAAVEYLDEALGEDLPPRDEVVHELVQAVKRYEEGLILEKADKLYSKNGSITSIRAELDALDRLGRETEVEAASLGKASFDLIRQTRRTERLSTGITELDALIDGGWARGQLLFFTGDSGGGKSQALSGLTASALLNHVNTLVVTLELGVGDWLARLYAGLTDVPQKAISDCSMIDLAEERLGILQSRGLIGELQIRYYSAAVTQIEEIWAWVDEQRAELFARTGQTYSLLVVDYADKFGWPRDMSKYDGMGHVYEGLRVGAKDRHMWAATASQSKGKDKQMGKKKDMDDTADSKNKQRVTDLLITLNGDEANETVDAFVAKNRTGESRKSTGPIPTDFAYGRLVRPPTPSMFETPRLAPRPPVKQSELSW